VQYSIKYNFSNELSVVIATIITTIIVVILGETVPKNIGSAAPEQVSYVCFFSFLYVFAFLLKPLAMLLSNISRFIISIFGIKQTNKKVFENEDEVLSMIEIGKKRELLNVKKKE